MWRWKVTPGSAIGPNVSATFDDTYEIDYVELKFPLSNSRQLPDKLTRVTYSQNGTLSGFLVTPSRLEQNGFAVIRIPINPALTGSEFHDEVPVIEGPNGALYVGFAADPGGLFPSLKKINANAIAQGMSVCVHGVPKASQDITPPVQPGPDWGTATITVKVAGDRNGNTRVPLAGAKLQLHAADNTNVQFDKYYRDATPGANNYNWGTPGRSLKDEPWGTCTSDAQGNCTFRNVPAPPRRQAGTYYWVSPLEAPKGWLAIESMRVGGAGSDDLRNQFQNIGASIVLDYAYRTPELHSGDSITSGKRNTGSNKFENRDGFMNSNISDYFVYFTPGEGTPTPRSSSEYMIFTRENPPFEECRPLRIGMFYDISDSIRTDYSEQYHSTGLAFMGVYKQQLLDFAKKLNGTGAELSLVPWADGIRPWDPADIYNMGKPRIVNDKFIQDAKGGLDAVVVSGGATNWDRALREAAKWNDGNPDRKYDLVFLATDGSPTLHAFNNQSQGPGSATDFKTVENAVVSANYLKSQGTRVVGVGIGGFLKQTENYRNFVAAMGPNGSRTTFDPAKASDTDWLIVRDIETLAESLVVLSQSTACESRIVVKKETVDENGNKTDGGAGWHFSTSDLQKSAGVTALSPNDQTTGDDSRVNYAFSVASQADKGSVTISEALTDQQKKAGWSIQKTADGKIATCVDASSSNRTPIDVTNDGETGFRLADKIKQGARIECTVVNTKERPKAKLTLVKKLNTKYDSDANVNQWNLSADGPTAGVSGQTGAAAVTKAAVTPGEYTLSESLLDAFKAKAAGYQQDSLVCVDEANNPVSVTDKKVAVKSGDDITCTFTNSDKPGTVTWQKVAKDDSSTLLGGSQWSLQRGDDPEQTVIDCDVAGADATDSSVCTGLDKDPRKGVFKVTGLKWGDFKLKETRAPVGYKLADANHPFQISASSATQLSVNLGNIENDQQDIPQIPLTGGIGEDLFLFGGLGGAGLCGALLIARKYWRQRRAVSSKN